MMYSQLFLLVSNMFIMTGFIATDEKGKPKSITPTILAIVWSIVAIVAMRF